MAPHSSTLAWKIPWTEEPGRLQSMGSLSRTRLSNFTFTFHFHALEKAMATHSSVLAWRIPGTGEPGGLPSMGSHRVGQTEATQQQQQQQHVVYLKLLYYCKLTICVCVQSHLTLCDPTDCNPSGFSVRGIFQARILRWVDIPFSRGSSQPRDQMSISHTAGRFFIAQPWRLQFKNILKKSNSNHLLYQSKHASSAHKAQVP